MKRALFSLRARVITYLVLGTALCALTVSWLCLALYALCGAGTLLTDWLLAVVGLPITLIYSLNHVSGHLLWAADNWREENKLARRLPRMTCLHFTLRQWRCLLFLATDIPLAWVTVADCFVTVAFVSTVVRECRAPPPEQTMTLLLCGLILNLFYTYNNVLCHLSWVWDNWLRESRGEQQRRNSVSKLRWWAWRDWSTRQKRSFVLFLVPDLLLLVPATLANWGAVIALSGGVCRPPLTAELLPAMILTALYTYQNVYGHYCSVRQEKDLRH